MPSNFFSTKLFKVIIVLVIAGFIVFLNPLDFFNPIRSALFVVFSPVQKVVHGFAFECLEVKNFLTSIGQLKSENERLIKENREFLSERSSIEEIKNENDTLRKELGLLPREKFDLEGASVVAQDFHGQGDWLEIDKGERNGIKKGMPVIVEKGILVGEIGEVYWSSAKITLLANTKSAVNAIDSKTNSKGIVKGEYGMGIVIDMVLQSESLNRGDEVITSGIGKNFPKGLYIGQVGGIVLSPDRLFQKGIINSPVDFSKIQFVFVIKNQN